MMRLGIFGGSFDPVHQGHLLLAECCREQAHLDEVWFVPASIPPHKQTWQLSAAEHRVAMLELACAGHPPFRVSTLELDRGGVSYTVDTLAAIRALHPSDALFLLLGGDSIRDLSNWREPRRICELATPLVVCRPPFAEPDWSALMAWLSAEQVAAIRAQSVEMPQLDISSRDLRRRVSEHRSIRYQTPRAVERYIETHGLYASLANEPSGGSCAAAQC